MEKWSFERADPKNKNHVPKVNFNSDSITIVILKKLLKIIDNYYL
jgi:hypothetical protein